MTAHVIAYLDAGSGSMIVQILVGGVAAIAVSAKLFWRRILNFLHIRRDDDQEPAVQQDSSS
jgi:hypothetical protein